MRHIPATMATQHPDNARAPFWNDSAMIKTYQEIDECIDAFSYLGIEEYMWDWEGKHADASVVDKLLTNYYAYFGENVLGRDKFLTFRIPNIWEEKGYSLLQAMTVILSSEDFARDLEFKNRPLFEIILPMTVSAEQLMHMHDLFNKFAEFKSEHFTQDRKPNTDMIELIPLVESAQSQREIGKLLNTYIDKFEKTYNHRPEYIRPFIACSDPALTEGFTATRLSNKLALQQIYKCEAKSGVKMFPIAGSGSLPFRGGVTPDNTEEFIEEFAGLRTISIQSAFRYDYPIKDVESAVNFLNENLAKKKIVEISEEKIELLNKIASESSNIYRSTLAKLAPDMQKVFESFPKRRERRQHVGLLAYKRSSAGQSLPRAITFTGSFYSLGVPPELIASGRTLAKLNDKQLDAVLEFAPSIKNDLERAGRFLNKKNLAILAKQNSGWQDIAEDIKNIETTLKLNLGPETDNQKKHAAICEEALANINDRETLGELITKSGILRQSLG